MAKWFKLKEFECKCGCGLNNIDTTFLAKLDDARDRAGIAFNVNSGCRCPQHNKDEGGKEDSEHLHGQGVDLDCPGSFVRWCIVTSAIAAGIRRIGIGSNFIHLGDRLSDKPHPVIWVY